MEVKEFRNDASDAQTTLADAATGVVVGLTDAAGHPVASIRRSVHKLERKGAPVNRKLDRNLKRAAVETADFTEEMISGTLPERLALHGISMLKDRARRKDTVGEVLYRAFEVIHSGLNRASGTLTKFDRATRPPARPSASHGPARSSGTPKGSASRKRSTAVEARTSARRTARTTAVRARSTVRSAGSTVKRTATAGRKPA